MKVLIVKTSSLGDVLHTLPALTDAGKMIPGIQFDWVVEEAFAEIPVWHPLVNRVIPVALRRWRKTPLRSLFSKEWQDFKKELRKEKYDYVIDAQGLIKSAWLAHKAQGIHIGLNRRSLTEPFARLFYQKTVNVDLQKHAIWRMRSIFAQALGYEMPETEANTNISIKDAPKDNWSSGKYILFLHGTTWLTKHWVDEYWLQLAKMLSDKGYKIRLPWHGHIEHQRVQMLSDKSSAISILPKMNLTGIATILSKAKAVIAVDTGLGHLASALNVPAISLYGPTNPERIGTTGQNQKHLFVNIDCRGCDKPKCRYAKDKTRYHVCMKQLTPGLVFAALENLVL